MRPRLCLLFAFRAACLPFGFALPQAPVSANGALALGSWVPVGNMSIDRTSHTATRLVDGRVLVTGGLSAERGHLASAELYDPRTRTWQPTGNMRTARFAHSATLLVDGRELVTGGFTP